MPVDLHRILFQRQQQGQLGHFYLIPYNGTHQQAQQWMDQLLTQFLPPEKNSHLEHYPDILLLGRTKSDLSKNYLIDEIQPLFSFLSLAPFELPHRFIVLEHAHLLTEPLANKLLKSLEEPPPATTVFFLLPASYPMLPTVESRAIRLPLYFSAEPAHVEALQTELQQLMTKPFYELLEWVRSKPEREHQLVTWLLTKRLSCYQESQAQIEAIKWYQESIVFHNSPAERLLPFYQLVHA